MEVWDTHAGGDAISTTVCPESELKHQLPTPEQLTVRWPRTSARSTAQACKQNSYNPTDSQESETLTHPAARRHELIMVPGGPRVTLFNGVSMPWLGLGTAASDVRLLLAAAES